jgi:thioredoxin 2
MSDPELIRCAECGTMNRVPADRRAVGARAICGRCKRPLATAATPLQVTDETFAIEVEQSSLPVVVDLWAAWCGPCRTLEPVIAELAQEMSGRVRFAKLNVDENPATASRFNVRSIPTLLVLKGGKEIDRIVGALPKVEIARRVERHVA